MLTFQICYELFNIQHLCFHWDWKLGVIFNAALYRRQKRTRVFYSFIIFPLWFYGFIISFCLSSSWVVFYFQLLFWILFPLVRSVTEQFSVPSLMQYEIFPVLSCQGSKFSWYLYNQTLICASHRKSKAGENSLRNSTPLWSRPTHSSTETPVNPRFRHFLILHRVCPHRRKQVSPSGRQQWRIKDDGWREYQ